MSIMKRLGAFALAAGLLCPAAVCGMTKTAAYAQEPQKIDLYLIGGQSNAAGMSKHMYAVNEEFANIGYMGEVEHRTLNDTPEDNQITSSDTIKRGLGHRNYEIGPEYGMGKTMNGYYGGGSRAFIFKYAVGGTPMLEKGRDNWLPRSLWESGYEPDITKQPSASNGTGWLYSMFLNNFEICYNKLKSEGYTPVVKGMAWMQGEGDLVANHEEYAAALEAFTGDIRTDLSEITGDSLGSMPFVIGEIATTYQQYNNPLVPSFIEAQRSVAQKVSNVATIATDDLVIVNEYGGINGSDNSHFNVNDQVTLGQRFGRKLLEMNGKKTVEIEEKGGIVTFDYTNSDSLVLTLNPENSRVLTEFTVNGQDVLSAVQNGKYTIASPAANTVVRAVFSAKTRFKVSYEKAEYGEFVSAPAYTYDGEVLKVKAKAAAGYEIVSVKYGETEMSYNEVEDCFEIVAAKADTVSMSTQKIKTPITPTDSGLEGWAIALIVIGCVLVAGGIGLTVFLLRKKKSK